MADKHRIVDPDADDLTVDEAAAVKHSEPFVHLAETIIRDLHVSPPDVIMGLLNAAGTVAMRWEQSRPDDAQSPKGSAIRIVIKMMETGFAGFKIMAKREGLLPKEH